MHIAHIKSEGCGNRITQSCADHCRRCAFYASEAMKPLGFESLGYLAGLLHDMGKFTEKFDDYITRAVGGENVVRGSVNHTFAAVVFALEHSGNSADLYDVMTNEIIAFACGSHHGLFDLIDEKGRSGFLHRLNKDRKEICFNEAVGGFFAECADTAEIDALFGRAAEEIKHFAKRYLPLIKETAVEFYYNCGMLARMLLSAVIEGDRRDTAEFSDNVEFPPQPENACEFWQNQLDCFEKRISVFVSDTPINIARKRISDECRSRAEDGSGVFRLSVPTGSGKTLASMRYAISHAARHRKKRIIFVIPLLSVLEQNAKVIRENVADPAAVFEHHSNVVIDENETPEKLTRNELLAETWDSPIIVTTLVQLLNTLFLGKTTSIRRMHSLADSVIVFDEVQSLPTRDIHLFNLAVNFLADYCGTTVVLCSATQPCFERVKYPVRLGDRPDIVPDDKSLRSVFHRTNLIDRCCKSGYTFDELADKLCELSAQKGSVLMICNTKKEAAEIFSILSRRELNETELFHLSTAMCMQHRKDVLDKVLAGAKKRMICVSTQLIEAGVDVSFNCVVRVIAGLDSIVQAAGRCNRNGESEQPADVYIVNLRNESLRNLNEISYAQQATKALLYSFGNNPIEFDCDLTSDKSVGSYYERYFAHPYVSSAFNYPVDSAGGTLLDMLSENKILQMHKKDDLGFVFNQSFATAGRLFSVFDSLTTDVIVPYNREAEEIITHLGSEQAKHDNAFVRFLLKKAKFYTVSVFDYQIRLLEENGGVFKVNDLCLCVKSGFYNSKTGLDSNGHSENKKEYYL